MSYRHPILSVLVGMALAGSAVASDGLSLGEIPPELLKNEAFLHGHPDVRWRVEGSRQLHRGDTAAAMESFTRAARFADKPSQAAIAELLWEGTGTARNRPLAYAWMDLAAERGYPPLLAEREAMWAALDAGQQDRAIEVGRGLYAEYGDEVARPRMAEALRIGLRRSLAGSRTGWSSGVRQLEPNMDGFFDLRRGATARIDTLDPRWWDPERYWQLQDERWAGASVARRD